MNTISIPINEYRALQEELKVLREQELLKEVNHLLDLMYERKYGLYMGDYTGDLTEATIEGIKE